MALMFVGLFTLIISSCMLQFALMDFFCFIFVHLDYLFELCMWFTHSYLSWEVRFLLQWVGSWGPRFNSFRKYLVVKFYFFLHGATIFLHLITIDYQVLHLLLQMVAHFLKSILIWLPIFYLKYHLVAFVLDIRKVWNNLFSLLKNGVNIMIFP